MVGVPDQAALGEDERTVGRGQLTKQPSHDLFRMPEAVHGRRVNPVDAHLDRVPHRGHGIGVILRSPAEGPAAAADGPRSEANPCDVQPAATERERRYCHDVGPSFTRRLQSRVHAKAEGRARVIVDARCRTETIWFVQRGELPQCWCRCRSVWTRSCGNGACLTGAIEAAPRGDAEQHAMAGQHLPATVDAGGSHSRLLDVRARRDGRHFRRRDGVARVRDRAVPGRRWGSAARAAPRSTAARNSSSPGRLFRCSSWSRSH